MSKLKLLLLLGVIGLLIWTGLKLFPDDESRIRAQLKRLTETVSVGPEAGTLDWWAKSERLASFFADDLSIEVEGVRDVPPMTSKLELTQNFLALKAWANRFEVRFSDLLLKIGPEGETATVLTSALVRVNGAKEPFAQELKLSFRKDSGQWLITRVEALQTLQ